MRQSSRSPFSHHTGYLDDVMCNKCVCDFGRCNQLGFVNKCIVICILSQYICKEAEDCDCKFWLFVYAAMK